MPADIETIADEIAQIVMEFGADSAEARDAIDNLLLDHGPAAIAQAAELVRAKVAG